MTAPPRVANHPLIATLNTLRTTVAGLAPPWTQSAPDIVERTKLLVGLLDDRLEDRAVGLVADTTLSNFHSWVQQLLNEYQQSINSAQPQMLTNGSAAAALDAAGQNLGAWPVTQPSDSFSRMAEEAQGRLQSMQDAQTAQQELWRSIKDQQASMLGEAIAAREASLKRLGEQETAAGKLLAALGAEGTSTGYRQTAMAEAKQANAWRIATVVFGIITSVLGVLLFAFGDGKVTSAMTTTDEMRTLSTRLALAIPFVLLTLYAGRQSAGHRHEAREAKRLELAFGSIDAYLADLEPSSRSDLKNKLTDMLYGSEAKSHGPERRGGDYPTTADLLKVISEAISKIR